MVIAGGASDGGGYDGGGRHSCALPPGLLPGSLTGCCPDAAHSRSCPLLPRRRCRGLTEVERLGTVERYFVEVRGIPRLAERIKCFVFSRTYRATHTRVSGGW